MLTLTFLVCALLLDNGKSSVNAYNYCKKTKDGVFCANKTIHFMCKKETIIPTKGKLMAYVPLTNKILRVLLQEHNEIRNVVAGGHITSEYDTSSVRLFPKAAALRELVWDAELAFLAREHAGQCNSLRNTCHNAVRYPYTGQALGIECYPTKATIMTVIEKIFSKWFKEKDLVGDPMQLAGGENFYVDATQFAAIVHEYTSHVGCAISYCTKCDVNGEKHEHCYFLICNYNMKSIPGIPNYEISDTKPAIRCDSWESKKSKRYGNLCSNSGRLFHHTSYQS